MGELLTIPNLANLGVLIFLQAVLGFDNLLYISIESRRAPEAVRSSVRRWSILVAVALRIVLLFAMVSAIDAFEAPFFAVHWGGVVEGAFNFATIVFLLGGAFIMYTAVKEILHLLSVADLQHERADRGEKGVVRVAAMIVLMNLVFSFDSILSAMAITRVFAVLAAAIVVSGVLMMVLADRVSAFIEANRKYEVLGLFILLIVGVVLLGEGGHEAHLHLFGHPVEAMSKTTFYFSVAVLVVVDLLQSGYKKKLDRLRAEGAPATA